MTLKVYLLLTIGVRSLRVFSFIDHEPWNILTYQMRMIKMVDIYYYIFKFYS